MDQSIYTVGELTASILMRLTKEYLHLLNEIPTTKDDEPLILSFKKSPAPASGSFLADFIRQAHQYFCGREEEN
ncbi:hypothetical protein [Desmospora activa]|uniref:Uncharacterized protein n=1 Tax=Desmospora activa DSM 45169 TaxID=1121389 RepID=A0A2T4ZA03_9BACL|nr:hypothetical protein [Desmospora activa]PTM58695.1 hypothetical protein C8J48_1283 [Desmospora activa DSM 45169]